MANQTLKPENNIDQIRELIFGPTMRDYERRFEAIQKQIQELKADLEKKLGELQETLRVQSEENNRNFEKVNSRLEESQKKNEQAWLSLKSELMEKITLLENDKTDRLQLANFLSEMALRLKGNDILQELSERAGQTK